MPIPRLDENGFLPEGVHETSLEEVRDLFGFQRTDQRPSLFAKLVQFIAEVRSVRLVVFMIVDGSFVTAKDDPSDIDILLVLNREHDFSSDLKPFEYNVLSRRRVRNRFRFDILVAPEGSVLHEQYVGFFQQVKNRPELRKGILKVPL